MNQQLNNLLTCKICLNLFKEPKILPCQHSYCARPCLMTLIDFRTKKIKCPQCSITHSIPRNGIDEFPDNIHLTKYLQKVDIMVPEGGECTSCFLTKEYLIKCIHCNNLYCIDCNKLHFNQLREEFKKIFYEFKRLSSKFKEKVANFDKKSNKIRENFDQLKKEVKYVIDTLMNELRLRESTLNIEIDQNMQFQLISNKSERQQIENELNTFHDFCDETETFFNKLNVNEMELFELQKKLNFLDKGLSINTVFDDTKFAYKYRFNASNTKDIFDMIQNFGKIDLTTALTTNLLDNQNQQLMPKQKRAEWDKHNNNSANLNNIIDKTNDNLIKNGQKVLFDLESNYDKPINGFETYVITPRRLQSIRNFNRTDPVSILEGGISKMTQVGDQTRPKSRPIFGVATTIRDQLNDSSHNSSFVYEQIRPRSRPIYGGTGISSSVNNIVPPYVRSDTFELENPTMEKTPNIDKSERQQPKRRPVKTPVSFQVMLDDNVNEQTQQNSAAFESMVPRIDYATKLKARVIIGGKEGKGRQPGEFLWPIGVAVNQVSKTIYITDSSNHRVQVFDENGYFMKTFGVFGTRDGQFDSPTDLTLDPMATNIFVVDQRNHRIQVFDRYCRFLRKVGNGPGNAEGELNFPWGISVTKLSEIFVADKENDRICVFHLSGKFLRYFGTYDSFGYVLHWFGEEGTYLGQLKYPRGIKTDSQGFILVADSGNSRIQIFRPDGSFVSSFGAEGTDSGKFRNIEALCVSFNGDLLICDKENHRVQIL